MGLAVGDALGTTLEFKAPGTFEPIEDMVGGGPFHLKAGQWTDDTSMAMCLAESLVARRGFDPADQMDRYRQWFRAGYWSCLDRCFDIGNTVRNAVVEFEKTGEPFCGSEDPQTAGNGSIMRLVPVPLYYAGNPKEAIRLAAESSRTTHAARTCLDACRLFASLMIAATEVDEKDALMERALSHLQESGEDSLCPEMQSIAEGSYLTKEPPEIKGTGYVVDSLEAALWAFFKGNDFREGALLAVNLGDDADTTGAVFGQLAGIFYQYDGIPVEWREKIAWKKQIERLAEKVFRASLQ